jgi:polysaccharide export outer membrane protein
MHPKREPFFIIKTLLLLVFSCLLFSCVSTKKAAYFNNVNDTSLASVKGDFEPVIQKNDILQINVSAMNPQEAMLYNLPNTYSPGAATPAATGGTHSATVAVANPVAGYLVNQEGYIQFPVLGSLKAAGLTKKALTDTIRNQLSERKLLVDPVVSIRFLNYRVTILGEVTQPAVVNVTSEKISIMEALGMVGDITIYGKKDNVLLIRETEGERITKRLNLNDAQMLTSPYYFLKPNDVIYVEPNKSKVANASKSNTVIPVVLSGLSLLVIVLDRLVK